MAASKSSALLTPLLLVAVGSAAYLGAQNVRQQRTIDELRGELARLNRRRPAPAIEVERTPIQIVRKSRYRNETVVCSLCEGQGELLWQRTRKELVAYPCPLCKAQGERHVRVPHDGELCNLCHGMGKLGYGNEDDPASKKVAKLCTRCNGKGWRKSSNG